MLRGGLEWVKRCCRGCLENMLIGCVLRAHLAVMGCEDGGEGGLDASP